MKLLLTSAGWGENPAIGKELLKLVNKKPAEIKIFLVITPIKYLKRNKYILKQLIQFNGIKIPEKNITFFQLDRKVNKKELTDTDVIFVFGGNTFEYLSRIKETGLYKIIKDFVKKDGVYVGLSAGSYIAAPTIEAATWKNVDENLIGLKNLKSFNFVPFLVTAHLDKKSYPIVKEEAKNTKYKIISLTDEQAILINGNNTKIIGKGKKNIFNQPKIK